MPNGSTESVKILIGAKLANSDIVLEATKMMVDASALESIKTECSPKIAAFDKDSLLYVTLESIYNESNAIDVAAVIKLISNIYSAGKEYTAQHTKMIMQQLVAKCNLDEDTATCVVWYTLEFLKYEREGKLVGPINVGPSYYDQKFFTSTQLLINEINAETTWPFSKIKPEDNVTVFQNTATDTLFIELPNRNQFLQDEFNIMSIMPAVSDLCEPYRGIPIDDITLYKSDERISPTHYRLFEGEASNNTCEIFENEKLYYDSLIEWVKFNMKNAALGDIDVSPSNPNLDKISQNYLEELAKVLYTRHWYHNINIPIYNPMEQDEDDDMLEMVSDSNVVSDYKFRPSLEERDRIKGGIMEIDLVSSKRVNALERLVDFLSEASLSVGYIAYIQAIIQLARWGDRKPSNIIIDGYSLVFSLNDNKIKPYMGNISNYQLVEVDGCPVKAIAGLYHDVPLKCREFLLANNYSAKNITAPVGLNVVKQLQNQTNSGPKQIMSYMSYSIIDVVNSYINNGDLKIAGISFDGDKFTADDAIALDPSYTYSVMQNNIKEEDNLESLFKASQDLEDYLIELGINSAKIITHFDILSRCARHDDFDAIAEAMHFSSKADFIEKRNNKIIKSPLEAFVFNYGMKLFKVYIKVSLRLNELQSERAITMSDVLNVYKEILADNPIDLFAEDNSSVEKQTNVDVQPMNVFANVNTESTQTTTQSTNTVDNTTTNVSSVNENNTKQQQNATDRFSFIKEPQKDCEYVRLLDNKNACIGYFTKERVTVMTAKGPHDLERMILLTPDQVSGVPANKIVGDMPITKILYRMIFNLHSYEINSTERIVLFFSDLKCMAYYVKLIKGLF